MIKMPTTPAITTTPGFKAPRPRAPLPTPQLTEEQKRNLNEQLTKNPNISFGTGRKSRKSHKSSKGSKKGGKRRKTTRR